MHLWRGSCGVQRLSGEQEARGQLRKADCSGCFNTTARCSTRAAGGHQRSPPGSGSSRRREGGTTAAPATKTGTAKGAPPEVLTQTRTERSKRLHCEGQAACISPVCSTPEQERRQEQEGDSGRALRRRLGVLYDEPAASQGMTPEEEARFARTLAEEDRAAAGLGQKDGSKRRRKDPG